MLEPDESNQDYFSKNPQEDLALILDVGYNTLDFIAMKKDKLSIRNSFANTNGINIILNKLQYELNSQFDIKRTTTELNETISANNKTLKHRGEIIDFSDALKDITEDYIDSIKQDIVEKDNILERADILLIGGGGAYILRAISDDGLQKMFNFKNIGKIDTKKIGYVPVSYGVEIYYDKKPKLLFSTCLENEAIEIVKTLKMFIKGEEDEKIYNKYFRG